jgi:acyl-CoA dehydrogenase
MQARKFFTTELAPHQKSWEANGIVDREAWSKTGAAGFLLAEIPTQYGGIRG